MNVQSSTQKIVILSIVAAAIIAGVIYWVTGSNSSSTEGTMQHTPQEVSDTMRQNQDGSTTSAIPAARERALQQSMTAGTTSTYRQSAIPPSRAEQIRQSMQAH